VNKKALVILSGGQDSTTCLFWAKANFEEVHAITFNYVQRHSREIECAVNIAAYVGVESHKVLTLGNILTGSSPLVSQNALEQYPDMWSLPGGLEKTFVPGRNLLFLTLAANYAYSLGVTTLVTGVCQEDYGGYPDCRQKFIDCTQETIRQGFGYDSNDPFMTEFKIETPLMNLTKAETVMLALQFNGCLYALALTQTGYDGAYPPVGNDHATLLRAKGFLEAGVPDPLVVLAWKEGLMPLPATTNYTDLVAISDMGLRLVEFKKYVTSARTQVLGVGGNRV
jgi:7-cyano-7-deazaguanine synthase